MKPKIISIVLGFFITVAATGSIYSASSKAGLVLNTGEEKLINNSNYYLAGSIYGPEEKPLQRPLAVTAEGGKIYIADTGNCRVVVYSVSGRFIRAFGDNGDSRSRLLFPTDIIIGSQSHVYVADRKAGLVRVYKDTGEPLGSLPEGADRIALNGFSPLSMAVDSKGRLVVFDVTHQRIVFFDTKGKLTGTTGEKNTEKGPGFTYMYGLAIGNKDKVYAANSNSGTILEVNRLDSSLTPLPGLTEGKGFVPRGIAVDRAGEILFFADPFRHKIYRYSLKERKIIDDIGIVSKEKQAFRYPNDTAVDTEGRLFIADRENNRIVVLEPVENKKVN